ncbi:hypothetical protein YC2023_068181 [Brassica napus]|uniref:Uncharacterized protein n=2 Tax=Brassica TaxID=3705 RepID=M4CKC9_BRACM|nr:unnamed protein product [Brassica napus]
MPFVACAHCAPDLVGLAPSFLFRSRGDLIWLWLHSLAFISRVYDSAVSGG